MPAEALAPSGCRGTLIAAARDHNYARLSTGAEPRRMLETVFTTHVAELRTVEQATLDAGLGQAVLPGPSHRVAPKQAKVDERRERRLAKYQQVCALHRVGWTGEIVARHLGILQRTVVCYLRHETFPERRERSDAGCRISRRLFHEIQRQGYHGSYPTLARYTQRLRQVQEGAVRERGSRSLPPVANPHQQPLTRRTAAWLVLRHAENCDVTDAERLSRL